MQEEGASSMANHTTEIVHFQKLSNGQFLAMVRCCNNPSTDWPHVMAAEVLADDEKKKASISFAKQKCAELHEAAQKAELSLINEVVG